MPRDDRRSNWIGDLFPEDSPWGGVAAAVAEGINRATAPQQRLAGQLVQFMGHLQRAMMPKFLHLPTERCSASGCREPAAMYCLSCGEPMCLAHLHINHEANGVCDECVASLLDEDQRSERDRRPPAGLSPEVRKALRTLGLKVNVTERELDLRFRKLAAENHPDRAKNPRQAAKMQKKMSEITAAYHLLKRRYGRKAA